VPLVGVEFEGTKLRSLTRTLILGLILATPLLSVSAGAAPTRAKSLLSRALADGASDKSVTMAGTFTGSGITGYVDIGYSPSASGGAETSSTVGTEYIVEPKGKKYCFVKASSLGILKQALDVKKPTKSELNLWYKVTSKDPRYVNIASPNGAQTIAQVFSFSPVGWSRKVSYKGTTKLDGVRVYKLEGASNAFVAGTGFAKTTLYVTDSTDSLPFAMSGPSGTQGLIYFTKWNHTTVTVPFSDVILPK
jgi:hypothetical protein